MAVVAVEGAAFGEFVRQEREAKGWSRRALAQQLHRAPSVIQNIEEGISDPNAVTLAQMGRVFNWDFNRQVMPHFDERLKVEGIKPITSEIGQRPALRRLFEAARNLSNEQADLLATTAEAWAGSGRRKLGVQRDGGAAVKGRRTERGVRTEKTG